MILTWVGYLTWVQYEAGRWSGDCTQNTSHLILMWSLAFWLNCHSKIEQRSTRSHPVKAKRFQQFLEKTFDVHLTLDHVSYLIRNKKFLLFVCSVAVWDIGTQHLVLLESSFSYIIRIYERLTFISTTRNDLSSSHHLLLHQ